VKIKIKKIETYTITQSTKDYIFDLDEFRNCTPAFIGNTPEEFMDYITNDIEDIKEFIKENDDIICKYVKKSLLLLDVEPLYDIISDSRNDYEDSWFVMNPQIEENVTQTSVSSKSKNVL
tara:strand:- start:41 stop:400 length:360 start_codon:yes stop_codon:yes gene_type:complete